MKLQSNSKRSNYLLRFDGACSPNPGICGIGWVLFENEKAIAHESKQVGFGTNNVAEYLALIDGLKYLIDNNISGVQIEGDSQLVINQVLGLWKCKNANITGLCAIAQEYYKQIPQCGIGHIVRENNKLADFYSKAALRHTQHVEGAIYE